jgi:hypothetical protein
MLSSFKKPRKNASAAKQQKVNVAKKLADRPVSPPSSDSEVDSDSDSEYEEILISSINGQPKKVPAPSKESHESANHANHANHFTEPEPPVEIKKSAPIPIPKKVTPKNSLPRKAKSQKVVIKKYYQQRKKPAEDKVEPQKADTTPPAPQSYIGISSGTHSARTNTHSTMSSRILNW